MNRIEEEHNQARTPTWGKVQPGPFTSHIRTFRHEKEIQALRISFYSGVEDPVTHIHTFHSALGCKGLTDEGQCLLFQSTLTGAALNWFYRLAPGTVDSFDQLKQTFLNHFMIQTDRLYSADDLYTIRQQDDKPLREYAARFSHEYSRCLETDDRAAFGAFKSGLRSSQFRYLVYSSNWTTYVELMKQAAIHAKAEHFNSKGSASAPPSQTTTADRPSTQSHDRFPANQTISQAPYRTAPPTSAPYEARNKRKDDFRDRQDGGK
ncbi:uncharacterized protein LOC110758404 [Prunus avium]|uniref:Uncharacterized protein LOC110758404 n=1 Tax=Prunus avium TaxID=42229 RepID=A0A6P5SQI0_PRUAV|nr:uncharacterized protein LOC110758404 [Prunus avium]